MIAPTINTERLSIQPMSLAHWEEYAAAWADPRMTEFIGGEPRSRNVSWAKFLAGAGLWPVLGYGYWSFIERTSGAFVGNGGLAKFERGMPELEMTPEAGWALVADAWGKGYATEAMAAILAWADNEAGLTEVRCIIDRENAASHNVARKLGFEKFAESQDDIGDLFIYRREPSPTQR
jgi:RimJ/RimL family protein N-acetyltransferase